MQDPYEVLGIDRGVSREEVRAAYLRLATRFHPDRFAGASREAQRRASEQMQQVNHAYAVLTDPGERRRFERQQTLRGRSGAPDRRVEADVADSSSPVDGQPPADSRRWRYEPPPEQLHIREFSGWGDAHWVYVHGPGGRAGTMNVTTGEVTIEREDLRDEVVRLLQHYALGSWS